MDKIAEDIQHILQGQPRDLAVGEDWLREGDQKLERNLEDVLRIFHEYVADCVSQDVAEAITQLHWSAIRKVVSRLRFEREVVRGRALLKQGGAPALAKDAIALEAIRRAMKRLRSEDPNLDTDVFDEKLNIAETRQRRRSLRVVSR